MRERTKLKGRHLIIDAIVRDGEVLNNPEILCALMDELVCQMGMKYLQRPAAFRVPIDPSKLHTDADEGGWSVICHITTSHISIHGWPLRNAFMMDIFSCRDFDTDIAMRIVRDWLDVVCENTQVLLRGI